MKLKVNKDKCTIIENEIWNVGDYNVQTVQVELSDDFDGLVNKVRYFVEDKCYDMLIENNIAQIPYEATKEEGTIEIGVYGFDVDTDILVQSTRPVVKYISSGTYTGEPDNTEPLTPSDKQQMEAQIQQNSDDIDELDGRIRINTNNISNLQQTKADKTQVNALSTQVQANTTQIGQNKADITALNNSVDQIPIVTKTSQLTNDSRFITKDVNNLTYYTTTANLSRVALTGNYNDLTNKPDLSSFATTTELGNETTARENADIGLQDQIDAITSSSDVKDIVGTYTELQNYDTSTLGNDDIIKVLQDSTHNEAMTYYRWVISGSSGSWQYIGQEGPYYTKSETETLLNNKQNEITSSNKLDSDLVNDENQANKFVTASDITTWNNKSDFSGNYNDLTNKPTIPSEVTETTVSNWGFTKNIGTITGITMNGASKGTSGVVDLGTVITSHQDISGKANKISVVQTSASTIEINPNTFYKFGEVASLNITLASITDNTIYNEYMFEFVSGATATTLTLPSSVKWLETPTIEANKIYQCSIVDNIGVLLGVSNV